MSDTQQQQGQSGLLLNIIMLVLETFYSFILKHDRVVRLQAKKFVEQEITIKMNSYIPYFDFYLQFTEKGILFDLKAPEKKVDLSVTSNLMDLMRIFVFSNTRSLRKMRIEGDTTLKDEFKDLVVHFTLPKILSDWKNWLSFQENDAESSVSSKRIAPLLEKIDLQRSKINSLNVEVKQFKNRVRRLENSNKRLKLSLGITAILFITLIVYNLWQIF